MRLPVSPEVQARLARLELPFNADGLDPYGIDRRRLGFMFTTFGLFYQRYFRCRAFGIENIPKQGRAMLVGNHSGGVAFDAMQQGDIPQNIEVLEKVVRKMRSQQMPPGGHKVPDKETRAAFVSWITSKPAAP